MSSDEQKWWLAPPGMKPEGPWTISEIRSRVESSPAETDWQVCMEGSVEWQPLTDLPAFQLERTPSISVPAVSMEGTELNNYLIFMHLSQLGSLVVPMVGFVIPLVMWLVRKDENDLIDLQGREIIN